MKCGGLGNRSRTEIDTDAIGWLQGREQIPPATTQFQYPLPRRYQEPCELEIVRAIGRVELASEILFAGIRFGLVEQGSLSFIV